MQFSLYESFEFRDRYWNCVQELLEDVLRTSNAGDRLASYQQRVLEGPGADPALIYHASPLWIAKILAADPEIRIETSQVTQIMRRFGFD